MLQFVQMQNGKTAYKPKQEIHKVDGLIKYLRLMCIYGTCYLKKFPTRAPEFLQYLHSIIDADKQYRWPTVHTYDQKFQFHCQKNPAHSWAQVNWEFRNELAAAYNIKEFAPKHSPSKSYKHLPYIRPAAYCPHPNLLLVTQVPPFQTGNKNSDAARTLTGHPALVKTASTSMHVKNVRGCTTKPQAA